MNPNGSGLREFLQSVVRPNVSDVATHFADVRHAHNAISAVDALAAHLYVWASIHAPAAVAGIKNDTDYREKLADLNSDFALLRDIAKAQKHVRLTRGKPQVTSANQVQSRPVGYGEGDFGHGRYGGLPQIVVDADNGKMFYVEGVVNNALAFLEAEMSRLGA